ncbi:hypothetical protein GK047_12680 [Paenibacillus sp. SYP-B3998]|uniref:Polymerase nucleotidyl transferase domain-containing protein n=1 Tax=Paenibacillus sp. SYP-B3998 TaxID=2678564 RepID=A0A6G3ZZ59_9BACL|nr:nucleotidyltransferase domain-containing protein [Paenibacillus sp. SYP-B3998]NEW06861.1 hypothetical protein [Paenibacillus sp. SYP-B3998]
MEPEHIDFFIFGSYLYSVNPNDVDLIVIYDSHIYNGTNIFYECFKLINLIEETLGLPVDVTYLSIDEEIETQFVKIVEAKSINDIFNIGINHCK